MDKMNLYDWDSQASYGYEFLRETQPSYRVKAGVLGECQVRLTDRWRSLGAHPAPLNARIAEEVAWVESLELA